MLDNEYIRIERVHKGEIFISLEIDGKRCFPLTRDGIETVLAMVADVGAEKPREVYQKLYKNEPDIWDAIFESRGEVTVDDLVKQFNLHELPMKGHE